MWACHVHVPTYTLIIDYNNGTIYTHNAHTHSDIIRKHTHRTNVIIFKNTFWIGRIDGRTGCHASKLEQSSIYIDFETKISVDPMCFPCFWYSISEHIEHRFGPITAIHLLENEWASLDMFDDALHSDCIVLWKCEFPVVALAMPMYAMARLCLIIYWKLIGIWCRSLLMLRQPKRSDWSGWQVVQIEMLNVYDCPRTFPYL